MKILNKSKKITEFSAILIMLFSINCSGQSIPQKVKDSFTQKYPSAKNVEWGMESETEFEAEFKINGPAYSANFDTKGNWKETEMEISRKDLPDAVLATLARDYWESDINEIAKITTSNETLYKVKISVDDEEDEGDEAEEHEDKEEHEEDDEVQYETVDLIFNASGKLVNKSGMDKED